MKGPHGVHLRRVAAARGPRTGAQAAAPGALADVAVRPGVLLQVLRGRRAQAHVAHHLPRLAGLLGDRVPVAHLRGALKLGRTARLCSNARCTALCTAALQVARPVSPG